jgi:hypothetical protein
VPSSPDAAPAGGQGAGTGFVNLSRYFDANDLGAAKGASAVVDPLKVDVNAIGQAAHDAVPMPDAPVPVVAQVPTTGKGYPNTIQPSSPGVSAATNSRARPHTTTGRGPGKGATGNPAAMRPGEVSAVNQAEATNTANQAGFTQATAEQQSLADLAQTKATQDATMEALTSGRSYLENPNNLVAAMSKGGQTPSSFDAYLTGGAMPNAYEGLSAYYGNDAASNAGRSGGGFGRQVFPGTAPAPIDAAAAMDPQQRKKSKNVGGW